MAFAKWTPMLIILLNMPKILQTLFCSSDAFTRMLRFLYKAQTQQQQTQAQPAPRSPHCFLDLEMGMDEWTRAGFTRHHHGFSWEKTVVTFCLTSAIEVALCSVQKGPHLPPLIHLFNISVFFAFTSLFVSKHINSKFWIIGRSLEQISIFFVATAFVLATTIPYPVWLRCCTWAVYVISLLAIFISRCF